VRALAAAKEPKTRTTCFKAMNSKLGVGSGDLKAVHAIRDSVIACSPALITRVAHPEAMLRRISIVVGLAVGAALLTAQPPGLPSAVASGSWAGPYSLPRTSGLDQNVKILPVGSRLYLVQPALDAQGFNTARLSAAAISMGNPSEPILSGDFAGLWGGLRQLAFASSSRGITAAIRYRDGTASGTDGYATVEFNGRSWSAPTPQVQSDDYLFVEGHSIAEDASGNATYAWVQTATDRAGSQRKTHSFYVRQRIMGQWQERQLLYTATSGVDAPTDEVPDVSGPAVTSLATGGSLACSAWSDPVYRQPQELSRLRCWTSPGPGKEWTALPAATYPDGFYSGDYYSASILRDGTPMVVHFFMDGLLYSQFKGGSWSQPAPLAPIPSTSIPQPSLRLFSAPSVATDGQGNLLAATLLFERGRTTAGYEDEQLTVLASEHRGSGWSSWRKLSPTYSYLLSLLTTGLGVALSPQSAVVTWVKKIDFDGSPSGLYVNEYAGDAWSGPQLVSGLDTTRMGSQVFAGITADNEAAVAWDSTWDSNPFNSNMRLFGSRITPKKQTPGAPTNLRASASKGRVTLTWAPPAQGAGGVTDYQWRSQVKGATEGNWKKVAKGAGARQQVVLRIRPKVVYVFQVRAMAGSTAGPAATTQARGK
jgi:hypothetical protein